MGGYESGNRKISHEKRQDDWLLYFRPTIGFLHDQTLSSSDTICPKNSAICVMKEKQTPAELRLLLTFDNVKTTRRALELMELLGGK